MSELLDDLHSRIPVVAARTTVDREILEAAQHAVGLSNERLARLIPISEKTWRRWKQAGAIPTYALDRVSEALQVELPRSDLDDAGALLSLQRLGAAGVAQLLDGQNEALRHQQEILRRLARIEESLDAIAARERVSNARTQAG